MAVPQSFPAKIYQILENESPDIIQWNNGGASFRIVDHGRFEREIVPKYFRHSQISSVQRQLNLYGFKCISRGEFKRSFFHPKFRQGDYDTVRKLTRFVPPKKSDEKSFDPTPGTSQPQQQSRPNGGAAVSQQQKQPNSYPTPFFYKPTPAAAHQQQQFADDMALWPECWDSMMDKSNNGNNNGNHPHAYGYNHFPQQQQQWGQDTMILQTSMYHQPYQHQQSFRQQPPPQQHHLQQWMNAPVVAPPASYNNTNSNNYNNNNNNNTGCYPPGAVMQQLQLPQQQEQEQQQDATPRDSGSSVSSLMTEVSIQSSEATTTSGAAADAEATNPTTRSEVKHENDVPLVTAATAPTAATAVEATYDAVVKVNPDYDLFDDFEILDDTMVLHAPVAAAMSNKFSASVAGKGENPTAAAEGAAEVAPSTSSVAAPAPAARPTMCDSSTNTMLTYSKVHDSLVYMWL